MAEESELKTFNASGVIAKERDVKLVLWHTYAMRQVLSGEIEGEENNKITSNTRIMNQFDGLKKVIAIQKLLISTFTANVRFASFEKWKKSANNENQEKEVPFDKFECDYNKLKKIKKILIACQKDILEAKRTKKLDDDFVWEKIDENGNIKYELTQNFYDMAEVLDDTWEEINLILLTNKCISAGIEVNEELTYKEQEEEMKRRVVEA